MVERNGNIENESLTPPVKRPSGRHEVKDALSRDDIRKRLEITFATVDPNTRECLFTCRNLAEDFAAEVGKLIVSCESEIRENDIVRRARINRISSLNDQIEQIETCLKKGGISCIIDFLLGKRREWYRLLDEIGADRMNTIAAQKKIETGIAELRNGLNILKKKRSKWSEIGDKIMNDNGNKMHMNELREAFATFKDDASDYELFLEREKDALEKALNLLGIAQP